MPYRPHMKVSLIGVLGSTRAAAIETWSIGLRYRVVGGDGLVVLSQDEADDMAQAALTAAATLFGSTIMPNNCFLTEARTYQIGTDGKAAGFIGYAVQGADVKGGGAAKYPFQNAMVMTLVAEGRGKGKFGRVYLPAPNVDVSADGLIAEAGRDSAHSTFRSMLTALDTGLGTAYAGGDLELIVAGTTGTGTSRPVREVRAGRVMDTQRRRRRSLPESYDSLPYPA